MDNRITFEQAFELIQYDPETGSMSWKQDRSSSVLAGAPIGNLNHWGYLRAQIMGRTYILHRIAWLLYYKKWPTQGYQIDHINRIKTDNRIANLRLVTPKINVGNSVRTAYANGGEKYVSFVTAVKKWQVMVPRGNGRSVYIGRFVDRGEAVAARDAALIEAKRGAFL
ncbi:HNH endonuclease signature motif containing protein [Rhizobium rhizogenes]|uniref:HNH endonuclease signature motif containing protein n=1 Tax=Rhizobium rhizogenes TaxID=359 RepID=UPI001571CD68|nr:HNH endonuclease signature motif containing protein [Rhizobium rhizogenes]NTF67952.1 HNH endonuclease [Rhizobium rhizogenes]